MYGLSTRSVRLHAWSTRQDTSVGTARALKRKRRSLSAGRGPDGPELRGASRAWAASRQLSCNSEQTRWHAPTITSQHAIASCTVMAADETRFHEIHGTRQNFHLLLPAPREELRDRFGLCPLLRNSLVALTCRRHDGQSGTLRIAQL